MSIKVGIIPEHFSTPIKFSQSKNFFEKNGLNKIELIDFPSGSGHLINSLNSNEIDIAIGLTEAFVRGLANDDEDNENYEIIGTYVDSPLCWSISTGINRDDINSIKDLQDGNKKIGVSRIGSGSYVMSYVLGIQEIFTKPFFKDFIVLNNFENLRKSVNLTQGIESSDAFMWEYFTSKKYYDNKEIKKIGEIYTPWSSWVIVIRKDLKDKDLIIKNFLKSVQEGINYFNENKNESIEFIYNNLDYSKEDAINWLKTVKFSDNVSKIEFNKNILNTINILKTANVINNDNAVDNLKRSVRME
ncbi:transporter activity protein [[Candida] boidinii]|nr:transporter activity protein [[Candida] boidinii]OWB78318.1 transporter activity protein [[Candida] boidinii]